MPNPGDLCFMLFIPPLTHAPHYVCDKAAHKLPVSKLLFRFLLNSLADVKDRLYYREGEHKIFKHLL